MSLKVTDFQAVSAACPTFGQYSRYIRPFRPVAAPLGRGRRLLGPLQPQSEAAMVMTLAARSAATSACVRRMTSARSNPLQRQFQSTGRPSLVRQCCELVFLWSSLIPVVSRSALRREPLRRELTRTRRSLVHPRRPPRAKRVPGLVPFPAMRQFRFAPP